MTGLQRVRLIIRKDTIVKYSQSEPLYGRNIALVNENAFLDILNRPSQWTSDIYIFRLQSI